MNRRASKILGQSIEPTPPDASRHGYHSCKRRIRQLVATLGAVLCCSVAQAAPILVINQQGLDFGLVAVGSTAAAQTVTLNNAGDSLLTFTSIGSFSGEFAQSANTCGLTLAPGTSCTRSYTFSPTAGGNFITSATFTTDGGSASVELRGSGSAPSFPLTVSPTAFEFGVIPLGTTSPQQRVLVTNTSASSVSFTAAGGGEGPVFGGVTSCGGSPATLAAGASCYFGYAFSPSALGAATGSTNFSLTVGTVSQSYPVKLSGTGDFPLQVSPRTFDFGETVVGTTAAEQRVLVTNTSASSISFTAAGGGAGPVFNGGTSCGGSPATLAPGASCYLGYAFKPTALGAATGSTSFSLTVGTVSQSYPINLSGTGINAGAGTFPLVVSPTSFDFGATNLSQASLGQRVVISNPTASPVTNVTVAGGAIGGAFDVATSCGGTNITIAAGGSCYLEYVFKPTAIGPATGTTGISVSIGGNTKKYSLNMAGEGVFPLVVSPNAFDFGSIAVGATSPGQRVLISNPTASPVTNVTVAGGAIGGAFDVATSCGGTNITIAAGGSCYLEYVFKPTAIGPATGTTSISVMIGTAVQKYTFNFSGVGSGSGPRLQVSAYQLDFGPVTAGTSAVALSTTITNAGTAPMSGLSVSAPSAPFTLSSGTCPATLAAGASCTLNYSYAAPAAPTTSSTAITLNSSAGSSTVMLNARSVAGAGPSGPGGAISAVPVLGPWQLLGLASLLGVLGLGRARRR